MNSTVFEKYTKVVEAEFPRWNLHATIPSGVSLSIVFDHFRLARGRLNRDKNQVNLFFLSGTGMTKAIWRYTIKKLFELSESGDFDWQISHCIAIDLVNHGESAVENDGKLGWEVDWREGAHDLLQVAKSLRLPGENVVVGHSMGGFQALYITTIAPLLFKLCLAIEPVTNASKMGRMVFEKKRLPSMNYVIRSEFKNEDDYYTYFKTKSFYKNFHPQILNDFVEAEKIVNKDGTVTAKTSKQQQLICYLSGLKIFDISLDILKYVPVPVIHVVGEDATWNEKLSIDKLNEAIPDVELIKVKGGQHLVNCEKPDAVFQILVDGLKKHIGKSSRIIGCGEYLDKKKYNEVFNANYSKIEEEYLTRKKDSKL